MLPGPGSPPPPVCSLHSTSSSRRGDDGLAVLLPLFLAPILGPLDLGVWIQLCRGWWVVRCGWCVHALSLSLSLSLSQVRVLHTRHKPLHGSRRPHVARAGDRHPWRAGRWGCADRGAPKFVVRAAEVTATSLCVTATPAVTHGTETQRQLVQRRLRWGAEPPRSRWRVAGARTRTSSSSRRATRRRRRSSTPPRACSRMERTRRSHRPPRTRGSSRVKARPLVVGWTTTSATRPGRASTGSY
jgi:hypothetical protein